VHSVFGKINYGGFKTQQLILGSGAAIWWVTVPHSIVLSVVGPNVAASRARHGREWLGKGFKNN